jgi:diguanylate cyclase (GGDEF)-like protein
MVKLPDFRGRREIETMLSSRSPSAEEGDSLSPEDALRRRFVEAARRAEIVGLVNAANSEADLGLRFTEELCEVFDAELAFLLDEGDESNPPRAIASVGFPPERAGVLLDRTEASSALTHMKAGALTGEDVLGVGLRSAILAPFRTDDGRGLLVVVGRLYDRAFDETDRSLVEAVTLAVGQALERIWAYESRDRSARQQAALVRAAQSMSRSLEISEVIQTLCDESQLAIGSDTNAISLGDEVEGYVVVGTAGPPNFVGFRRSPGSGLGGRAAQAGRTMVTHSYQEDGYAPPEAPELADVRSAVAVPLRWADRVRGFHSCGWRSPKRITSSEVELLEGFAELAGLACANAERHATLREAAEVDGLTGCLNRYALQEQLDELIARAEQSGAPLSLALLDLDGFKSINDVFGHLSGDAVLTSVGAALRSTVRGEDVVARYGGDEFALILPDSDEERAAPVLDRVRAAIRSMDVPGGALTACVGLAERADSESLKDLLGRADDALREAKGSTNPGSIRRASRGGSVAPVPPRSRTTDDERRQRWRAVGGDIGLAIARDTDPTAAAFTAAEELREVLELEVCAVLRLASEGRLEEVASAGVLPGERWLAADRGTIGRALGEKRAVLGERGSDRRERDHRTAEPREDDRRTPGEVASELAVPLLIGGRAWGAIGCIAKERTLDLFDVELVAAVADHLSSAIRTGDLYEQLTESMIGTAEALAAALEAKDQYTADHARSIAELAVDVGRELDLPESAIEDLRYGGIFHDVGKIAVPDYLINKPGPLTEEEFEVVKEHPAKGAEILAPVPFLYGVRTIVRHAHEHYDGGGYPEGLRGEQIPLGARIVLAVDAYHAMTSDRPYRAAMSHQEALTELEDCSGTQFDPEVVEKLLIVLRRRADEADA